MTKDYLSHHGILGQKWGVKNGPPYPLSAERHNASEKKAGYEKSIGGGRNEDQYNRKTKKVTNIQDHKKLKEVAKAGMIDPLTAYCITIGVAYLASIGIVAAKGAVENSKTKKELKKYNSETKKGPIEEESGVHLKTRKYTEQEDIDAVNPAHNNRAMNVNQNCVLCSLSYELRQRGYDVSANLSSKPLYSEKEAQKVFKGAKEVAHDPKGLLTRDKKGNLTLNRSKMAEYNSVRQLAFQGKNKELCDITLKNLTKQPNSRGMLCVNWPMGGGHAMFYQVDSKGKVKVIDAQQNHIYEGAELEKLLSSVVIARNTRLDHCELDKKRIKEVSN